MFRPNIRGIPRRSLRFGCAGWHDTNSDQLIQHRWPWRNSWIVKLAFEPNLAPVLSRSGLVFLARNESAEQETPIARLRSRRKLVVSTIAALLVLATITLAMEAPRAQSKPKADTGNNLQGALPVGCESMLAEPGQQIESWLGGGKSQFEIAELQRHQIGGVQSRLIQVSCDSESEILRLTLVLQQKSWILKKFARLEN